MAHYIMRYAYDIMILVLSLLAAREPRKMTHYIIRVLVADGSGE